MKVLYMYEQMAQSHNVSDIIATMNMFAVRTGRSIIDIIIVRLVLYTDHVLVTSADQIQIEREERMN